MHKVNWGIIGLGNIAQKFAEGFKNTNNAKKTTRGSISEGRRASLLQFHIFLVAITHIYDC